MTPTKQKILKEIENSRKTGNTWNLTIRNALKNKEETSLANYDIILKARLQGYQLAQKEHEKEIQQFTIDKIEEKKKLVESIKKETAEKVEKLKEEWRAKVRRMKIMSDEVSIYELECLLDKIFKEKTE